MGAFLWVGRGLDAVGQRECWNDLYAVLVVSEGGMLVLRSVGPVKGGAVGGTVGGAVGGNIGSVCGGTSTYIGDWLDLCLSS